MVLEQEKEINSHYKLPDEFRHIRNSVSHPQLNDPNAKEYFQRVLGVDFPDLANPTHVKFLKQKSVKLLDEAVKLVERKLTDHKFWQ